ncbi:hypothetical protein Droror1_Dr00014987 [Drosera rotundifolia]
MGDESVTMTPQDLTENCIPEPKRKGKKKESKRKVRKHRPQIDDGRPIKTPKPKTPKETVLGKRKYARKTKLETTTTRDDAVTGPFYDHPEANVPGFACRQSLNFDSKPPSTSHEAPSTHHEPNSEDVLLSTQSRNEDAISGIGEVLGRSSRRNGATKSLVSCLRASRKSQPSVLCALKRRRTSRKKASKWSGKLKHTILSCELLNSCYLVDGAESRKLIPGGMKKNSTKSWKSLTCPLILANSLLAARRKRSWTILKGRDGLLIKVSSSRRYGAKMCMDDLVEDNQQHFDERNNKEEERMQHSSHSDTRIDGTVDDNQQLEDERNNKKEEIIQDTSLSETGTARKEQFQNDDLALVPYVKPSKKPEVKVDLDPLSERRWELVIGEYTGDTDEQEKIAWEREKAIFHNRVGSFIALMHGMQVPFVLPWYLQHHLNLPRISRYSNIGFSRITTSFLDSPWDDPLSQAKPHLEIFYLSNVQLDGNAVAASRFFFIFFSTPAFPSVVLSESILAKV